VALLYNSICGLPVPVKMKTKVQATKKVFFVLTTKNALKTKPKMKKKFFLSFLSQKNNSLTTD